MKFSKSAYKEYNLQREKRQLSTICHAPSTNLLFIQSGDIMACHYNRGYRLGRYPETSIEEAWNGGPAKTLRSALKKYAFPISCGYCEDEIRLNNFHSSGCKKYDYLAGDGTAMPVSMEFQTSGICNLECTMCSGEYSSSIRKKREGLPPYHNPYDDAFISQLEAFLPALQYAGFTGGEPFLNPQYFKIWEHIARINHEIRITVSTNGTVLNPTVLQFMEQLHMELTVSIDSLDPATYESIRKNASFEAVMKNIAQFMDLADKHQRLFSVKFVVMRQNIAGIPALFEYFHQKNVQVYPKLAWVPFSDSLRYAEADELVSACLLLEKQSFKAETDIQKFNCVRYLELIAGLKKWSLENQAFRNQQHITLNAEELANTLRNRINHAIENDIMADIDGKMNLFEQARLSIDALMAKASDDEERRRIIIKTLSLPSFTVINEIYRCNPENFADRFGR